MRTAFSSTMVELATRAEFVFLTGDLGFMVLEPVRQVAGARFINAGVAEQNMVSVAAGLARGGLKPWVYSIAPFLYARPFEQIRNDICHHELPVFLVGQGGGYTYGVMGATHHALEDYGVLVGLANMTAHIPAFEEDVKHAVMRIDAAARPAYLRLGRDEKPKELSLPPYAPWRQVTNGDGPVLVIVGPLAGGIIGAVLPLPHKQRPSVWVLTELPVAPDSLPVDFLRDMRRSEHLMVVEEHVAQGSAGAMLARALLERGEAPARFQHGYARGYPSGLYGSQAYHRRDCGLDPPAVLAALTAP